ncbi:MAG: TatD family deoxyribonuclease [Desulfobacteraceae bacterium]|nr:MAG: TatD family deoxyribonuclease [Desulfobacteraceae bacterium]
MKPILREGLVDAHAHLNEIEQIDQVLADARRVGVTRVVAVGMDRDSNETTLALASRFPGQVWPAVGYHPWSLRPDTVEDTLAHIRANLSRCVALGEVGLDYKAKVKKNFQKEVFERLLVLAVEHDKPAIIHCRFSHQRAHSMVRSAGVRQAVFHWYSGPAQVLEMLLADGYHISVTPALAYSEPHRAAAELAPLTRILVETDTPVSYQGRVSRPADLLQTIAWLSRIKQMPEEEVAAVTARNARLFYAIPSIPPA